MSGDPAIPTPTGETPSFWKLMQRGLTLACPACGRRGHFRYWIQMADTCHRCGLRFNRIEGHWIGAIGLNTIVSFGALVVSIIVPVLLTIPDIPAVPIAIANVAVALIFPVFFFPFSRTWWTAIDVAMRPLEPFEVDWLAVEP